MIEDERPQSDVVRYVPVHTVSPPCVSGPGNNADDQDNMFWSYYGRVME